MVARVSAEMPEIPLIEDLGLLALLVFLLSLFLRIEHTVARTCYWMGHNRAAIC